ncbi:MAG: hypothetical protein GVY11_07735 [Gammaproteobacteria bacterium]|jgi:sigma-E factor negative regulatory protein RseC|nr:hypothetical protein [Gammaproteobacteria bacterium]
MIWQIARVLARDSDRLSVEFTAPEGCERCMRGEGCGAGLFARLFSQRRTRLTVASRIAVTGGEWVRVGLEPRQLAIAAGLHYGLPLGGFLAGALAGHALLPDGALRDPAALAAGLAGFALVTRLLVKRLRPALNPVVERLSCRHDDASFFTTEKQQ